MKNSAKKSTQLDRIKKLGPIGIILLILISILLVEYILPEKFSGIGKVFNQAIEPLPSAGSFVPGRVLVGFLAVEQAGIESAIAEAEATKIIQDAVPGASINPSPSFESLKPLGIYVVSVQPGTESAAVSALVRQQKVKFAELDEKVLPAVEPNDPWYANWEYWLKEIGMPNVWDITKGSESIYIAILDSGVETAHEDLSPVLLPGWNVVKNNNDVEDSPTNGHGTATLGTAGAATNNAKHVSSVAGWVNAQGQKKIMIPVKITDDLGYTTYSNVASGITWVKNNYPQARVISISYAPLEGSSTVKSAAQAFKTTNNGLVITGSGNDGVLLSQPNVPELITVGANAVDDKKASFSNYGAVVDICAPGTDRTTVPGNTVATVGGTSISAPYIAGVVQMVMSANPSLPNTEVESILKSTAADVDPTNYPGPDILCGAGRVNAYAAVLAALGSAQDTTPPTVSITSPNSGATVSGMITVAATASDNVGVTKVDFAVDGQIKATDTSSLYSFLWDTSTIPNGAHTVAATAFDAAGNVGTHQITVSVSNAPDTTPPTVTLNIPVEGAIVLGLVPVSASASDNVGVTKVNFFVLTNPVYPLGTDTTLPYNVFWDSTATSLDGSGNPQFPDGPYVLQVTALDAAFNYASDQHTVIVKNAPDAVPPTVTITAPADGQQVGGLVSIQATAADNLGVKQVTFSVDGVTLAIDTTAPYSAVWDSKGVKAGWHTITAIAQDMDGNPAQDSVAVETGVPDIDATKPDHTPPVVTILSPANGAQLPNGGFVGVVVSASDASGISLLTIKIDGSLKASCAATTCSYNWKMAGLPNGPHVVEAEATDGSPNANKASTNITVTK